jgi:hypothetical protein
MRIEPPPRDEGRVPVTLNASPPADPEIENGPVLKSKLPVTEVLPAACPRRRARVRPDRVSSPVISPSSLAENAMSAF